MRLVLVVPVETVRPGAAEAVPHTDLSKGERLYIMKAPYLHSPGILCDL